MASPPRPHEFPPTRHVVAALIVSFALLAIMQFWTIAYLRHIAGGLAPFDLRPFGYSVEEARTYLHAISSVGRDYYRDVQLELDTVFPATYALSRALLLWWLTQPGRVADRPLPLAARVTLLALPLLAATFDYLENAGIAAMLQAGPGVEADIVAQASLWTSLKWLAILVTEAVSVLLLLVTLARRWHRRGTQVKA